MSSSAAPLGETMHDWARDLFPICRSITGPGVRETLEYLQQMLPALEIHSVPSGTRAFDWIVPDEWTIRDAFVADESGERIIDFRASNLHVVGYSEPVDRWMTLDELLPRLHSLPDQPEVIPYVTSYYERTWGFCISERQRRELRPGSYRVVIDADLEPGVLNYAELILPGEEPTEVLLSTFVCHPSMANNELSGPVVTTALAMWLNGLERRRHTYRIVYIPETIGSIVYLSRHLEELKRNVVAGFNITCVGDDRRYSYLPSRSGNTWADRAATHVLRHIDPGFIRYSWLDRGSDERQYCAPGVDLPVATIMRSRYGSYPEYHTSADDLTVITPAGLEGSYRAIRAAIEIVEADFHPRTTILCEPMLSRRGLYPTRSMKGSANDVLSMTDLLSYSDGERSLLEIAELLGLPFREMLPLAERLLAAGVLMKEPARGYPRPAEASG
jgi:aminopeptidase-like protein